MIKVLSTGKQNSGATDQLINYIVDRGEYNRSSRVELEQAPPTQMVTHKPQKSGVSLASELTVRASERVPCFIVLSPAYVNGVASSKSDPRTFRAVNGS